MGEQVLCCMSLGKYGGWYGVDDILLEEQKFFWLPRVFVEHSPIYQQLIPFVVVVCGDKVLRYLRSKTSESRLNGCYTLGFGGHINPEDGGLDDVSSLVLKAVSREIREELGLSAEAYEKPIQVGWISTNRTAVDEVHLGMVFLISLPSSDLNQFSLERGLSDLLFIPVDELNPSEYEVWGSIVVEKLRGGLLNVR